MKLFSPDFRFSLSPTIASAFFLTTALVIPSPAAATGQTFNLNNSNGDYVEISSDDINNDTYIFSKTVTRYTSGLLTTGVHYTGGQSIASNSNFNIANLQGSPIIGVRGQGTSLNYSGEWIANGGQSTTSLVLQDGGHFVFTEQARLNLLLENSFFTRQLWVLGDGTGTLEFSEAFVADRSQDGTVADGAGAYRLSNTTLITHHSQSLPVTPRPDGSGGLQTNGHLVFENEGGSTWITRSNAQEYPAAVWIAVDTSFQTETDLIHSGTTQFSSHFGSYWADNAFQTTQTNLTLTKTGAANLIFAAETAFIEGTSFQVLEGGLVFQSDPASGTRKGSSNTAEGGPNLQLIVGSSGVDDRNASVRFESSLSRIESISSTQGRIEVLGEVQMQTYTSNSQKDLPNNVAPPASATLPTTLNFHLSSGGHGKLVVSGDAALGGELLFTREPGFSPVIGTQFDVLIANSFSPGPNNTRAEFESVEDRSGLGLRIEYLADRIRATTTREASNTAVVIDEDWTDGAFDEEGWIVENTKAAFRNTGRTDPANGLTQELSTPGFIWPVRSLDVPGFYVSEDDVLIIGMTTFSDVAYNNQEFAKPEVAVLNNNYLADFGHDHATELSRKYFTGDSRFQMNPSVENDDNKQFSGIHHSGGSNPNTLESADRSLNIFRPTASGANSEGFGENGWNEINHTRFLEHFNTILISLPREFFSNRSPVFRTGTDQSNGQIGMSRAHVGVTKRTDANLDYATDAIDFMYWNSFRGTNSGMHMQWGDFDNDGDTDGDDLSLWQTQAGRAHDPNFNIPQTKFPLSDLPGSGVAPTFTYHASTGVLMIQTNGSSISAWAVEGNLPQSDFADGNWWQNYTAGKQQAVDPSLGGLSGSFAIATYLPGLSESSFGTITYGFADGGGGETSVQIEGTVASAYELWADSFGLTGDLRLPEADPAGDGISNLVKYGLGLSPNTPANMSNLMEFIALEGKNYLGIRFTRPENQTDLTTQGQATTDLTDWNAGAMGVSVTTQSNGDGTETVTIRSLTAIDEQPKMFIRALFNL